MGELFSFEKVKSKQNKLKQNKSTKTTVLPFECNLLTTAGPFQLAKLGRKIISLRTSQSNLESRKAAEN